MSATFQMALAKQVSEKSADTSTDAFRRPLQESRTQRSHMTFLDRMEVDARNKRIDKMAADMRQDEVRRHMMDKETRSRLSKNGSGASLYGGTGPRIVHHNHKKHYEGHHDKNLNWAPLDFC